MASAGNPWKAYVRPNFDKIVSILRPCTFTDRLFSIGVISHEEYGRIRVLPTSYDRSRYLLLEVLMSTGQTGYDKFLDCLRRTEGQSYVADILTSYIPRDRDQGSLDRPAGSGHLAEVSAEVKKDVMREVTRKDIIRLYEKVWHKWKALARFLELEDYEIDQIESKQPKDSERAYEMLKRWKECKDKEASVQVLCCALVEIELQDVANKVFGKETVDAAIQ
eukprot:m.310451 g.310451  ORF g.310451 m.310451 type:complete len:221 (+) comp51694_c0_seq1:98-760(+)